MSALMLEIENSSINLGSVEMIPFGEGRDFRIDDVSVAVFRNRDGKLYAVQSTCPHREGPLADGIIGEGKVICPLHSYKFDLATGQAIGNDCPSLKTYPVKVDESGDIILDVKGSGL
jgi:nitrite reductase (NADH) small subunit